MIATGDKVKACRRALDAFFNALCDYGDVNLGLRPGHLQTDQGITTRYRVTRRGNVYDDADRRSVFATWGMGSIRERHAIAQKWIDERLAST